MGIGIKWHFKAVHVLKLCMNGISHLKRRILPLPAPSAAAAKTIPKKSPHIVTISAVNL